MSKDKNHTKHDKDAAALPGQSRATDMLDPALFPKSMLDKRFTAGGMFFQPKQFLERIARGEHKGRKRD